MELRQLKQFKMVAECKTMTEASERLHISQPALSAMLKKLEDELGVSLFERKKNKISINEAGLMALKYATDILARAEQMKEALKDFARKDSILKVGFCDPGPMWITIPRFSLSQPKYELKVKEVGFHEDLSFLLKNDVFDLIVASDKIEDVDITCIPFLRDKILLSVPKESALTKLESISIEQIKPTPILMYFVGGEFFEKQKPFWQRLKDEVQTEVFDNYFLFRQKVSLSQDCAQSSVLASHLREQDPGRILIPTTDKALEIQYYLLYKNSSEEHVKPFLEWVNTLDFV